MEVVHVIDDDSRTAMEDGEIIEADSPPPTCALPPEKQPSTTKTPKSKKSKKSAKKKKTQKTPLKQLSKEKSSITQRISPTVNESPSVVDAREPQKLLAGKTETETKAPEVEEDDQDARTLFIANISEKVTEELLYELMLQAGPIEEIRIPKDRETKKQKTFGFIQFKHRCAVEYACKIFEGTRLFGRELKLKNRNREGASGGAGGGLEALARGFHQSQAVQMRNNMDFNNSNQTAMMMNQMNSPMMNMSNPLMMMGAGSPNMMQNSVQLANMMPQVFQNLNNMNPFSSFGQYPSQNQDNGSSRGGNRNGGNWVDRPRHDWRNNQHNHKPYDRNERDWDRDRDNRGNRDDRGGRDWVRNYNQNRNRSRSPNNRRRSRSRSRNRNQRRR